MKIGLIRKYIVIANYLETLLNDNHQLPGPWFNIKMPSDEYRKSHCGDKTVVRSSYLHNGISCTGKITSLYWIRALDVIFHICISIVGYAYIITTIFQGIFRLSVLSMHLKYPKHQLYFKIVRLRRIIGKPQSMCIPKYFRFYRQNVDCVLRCR